jgi:CheY-like chemotaxis protein
MQNQNLILVAEDDPVVRMVVVKQLSKLGYVAHTAEDGQEAALMAAKIPYCMILMDILMPKMDGIAATREIRKHEREGHRTPIIALTSTTDKTACVAAGMDDFLSKPITVQQIQAAIEKYVGPVRTTRSS